MKKRQDENEYPWHVEAILEFKYQHVGFIFIESFLRFSFNLLWIRDLLTMKRERFKTSGTFTTFIWMMVKIIDRGLMVHKGLESSTMTLLHLQSLFDYGDRPRVNHVPRNSSSPDSLPPLLSHCSLALSFSLSLLLALLRDVGRSLGATVTQNDSSTVTRGSTISLLL